MKKDQVERLIASQALKSGQRARIVAGKRKGHEGVVFFVGKTKYGERVGLKGADGQKEWARPDQVVSLEAEAAETAAVQQTFDSAPAPAAAPDTSERQARWQMVLDMREQVARLILEVGTLKAEIAALQPKPKKAKTEVPPAVAS